MITYRHILLSSNNAECHSAFLWCLCYSGTIYTHDLLTYMKSSSTCVFYPRQNIVAYPRKLV